MARCTTLIINHSTLFMGGQRKKNMKIGVEIKGLMFCTPIFQHFYMQPLHIL